MLLAKVATEASTGGAAIYSNIVVVPKCMASLYPILNLK